MEFEAEYWRRSPLIPWVPEAFHLTVIRGYLIKFLKEPCFQKILLDEKNEICPLKCACCLSWCVS